jgi:hypothetical protein
VKDPYCPQTCASDEKLDIVVDNGSAEWINDDAAAAELAAAAKQESLVTFGKI